MEFFLVTSKVFLARESAGRAGKKGDYDLLLEINIWLPYKPARLAGTTINRALFPDCYGVRKVKTG